MKVTKILCLCAAGMVRSHTLVVLLKARYGIDALAAGVHTNSAETLDMLYKWADVLIILDNVLAPSIPEQYRYKLTNFNVGPDIWMQPCHPDLVNILNRMCDERIKRGS